MMMKIRVGCAVAALAISSLASFAHAQHNHIQSSISGQYDRRIHDGDQSAGATTQATEKSRTAAEDKKEQEG